MKPEEALKIMQGVEEVTGTLPEDGLLVEEALIMAKEAIEKQIIKDPTSSVWRKLTGQIRLCPTCRNTVSRAGRYCQNCGQRVRV